MAAAQGLPLTAVSDALYHHASRRPLADVLTCIREKQRLDTAGALLSRNAERQILDPAEMARRWRHAPQALANAAELAGLCDFAMDDLSYEYPDEVSPGGRDAMGELEYQTWNGAGERYPDGVPDKVAAYLERELALIAKMKFAPYFLTVFDIVRFARNRGILCQGRGSAANSAVCYCLGITSVDPDRSQPLFERFISEARGEPPDIDVDFEHERREEVIQHIYARYGRTRAGLTAAVITYRTRSALRGVLERTLGVPLFQEQAMQIAIVGAGFTGSEADQLRRAMATFKKHGDVAKFHDKMISGMIARGYEPEFAERCFRQIEGFGTYGFPESHAASFALLVYVSAWIKRHYPDVFICALLNAQPMGFYSPSQLVAEARRSGIAVRPADVSHSGWDSTLEPDPANRDGLHALRLGLRLVKGLAAGEGERIAASRGPSGRGTPWSSLADIMRRADVSARSLEAIANADGFASLGLNRRQALWEVRALAGQRWQELPLFAHATRRHHDLAGEEPAVTLPQAHAGEEVAADYRSLGLSLKDHPVRLLSRPLAKDGWQTCAVAHEARDGQRLRLAGLVTMRQRPGTAKGTVFLTLEDGLHSLNVIIWPKLTETYRDAMLRSQILGVVGRIQREKAVLHFIADQLFNLNGYLRYLDEDAARNQRGTRMRSRDFR